MSEGPRDSWSKLDIITKAMAAILIPLVVLIASNLYTQQQRTANERSLKEQSDAENLRFRADRLAMMAKSLSSQNDRERIVALMILEDFSKWDQIPFESLRAVLNDFAKTGLPAEQKLATEILQNHLALEASTASYRPRLYLDICNESQRPKANEAKSDLESAGFDVLAIGSVPVGPPQTTQVRYFHSSEQREAKKIADILTKVGLRNVKEVYFEEYEDDSSYPRRQYEVRFSVIALNN